MILVALAMVAIIAMAALSIDVVTLYLAREEAQRSADAAALAAARVLSISGITGTGSLTTDNGYWVTICGGTSSVASQTAQAVGIQNGVGSIAPTTVTVTYSAGSGGSAASNTNCSGLPAAFAVNPMVTVQVTRASMPTFFSRIWGNTGNSVSATATAEAYNPSNSGNVGNGATGTIIPVLPRCVKPWVVPNRDPLNPAPKNGNYCNQLNGPGQCSPLVNASTGAITNEGISLNGGGANGTVGETLWLIPDCQHNVAGTCQFRGSNQQPEANYYSNANSVRNNHPPSLLYVPGQVTTPVIAVPSCTQGDPYEEAIEGCDQSTNYQCGVPNANNVVDLSRNPGAGGMTTNGVQCLTRQTDTSHPNGVNGPSGQDYLNTFGAPAAFPFQILAGSSTPLTGMAGNPISSSNSIVSLPIYDDTQNINNNQGQTTVTFVGFLQVFINAVDAYGNVNVTILNVTGCSNGAPGNPGPVSGGVLGSSPVPIRLITPP
jgi:Flp pilus assembly protein TadG